jgi:hypothetical protein
MYRIQYFCICTLCFCALLVVAGCGSNPIRTGGNSPPGTNPPTPPPPPPPSATVVVTPASATVLRGKTQLFTATVSGQADQTVIWSLDDRIGSIDSTGLYTAPSDSSGQPAFVRATSKAVPSEAGTATVTLPVIPFSITPDRVGVVPGASQAFSATVVGLDSTQVTWTVQGGGTITSAGVYSAPSTSGLSYVVATSSANTNYSATAPVLVATNTTVSSPTGNLQDGREFHTATLLPNGKVLVAGGADWADGYACIAGKNSAELYDSALGTFASTATMTNRRYVQTSTLLQDGTVLITGGFSFDSFDCDNPGTSPAVASAEIYDPSNGSFAPTGNMAELRGGHTATLLTNGKVLIAGGDNMGGNLLPFFFVDGSVTAEVYDPATGLFTSTGNMVTPRVGQTATLLVNGDVLFAGGWSSSQNASIATAELYHAATGTFTPTTISMNSPRAGHTATLLPDGKVLIAGGAQDQTLASSDSAEIYDPATGSFLATGSMAVKRCSHTATLLSNGTVLIAGGGSIITEIYDPSTASFVLSGLTEFDRSGHSATLLQNGNLLVVGGLASPTTAELYP